MANFNYARLFNFKKTRIMKSKIILIILLLLSAQAFSQITLTNFYNPIAGDLQQNTDCDTAGVFQGNSGANQSWSFANISSRSVTVSSWIPSTSTPYSAQFPTSNIAVSTDNSNYGFYSSSNTNLILNGYAGPGAMIPYTNPEIYLQYPFTYNSSFTDNFSASFMIGGIQTYRTGTVNAVGDAWGTITLPNGTYSNALRVKFTYDTRDSSYYVIPIVNEIISTSYVWFIAGFKFPVFEISYTTTYFNGNPQASLKNVNYNPGGSSIGINPISSGVPGEFKLYQNYPNPFNPNTKIKFDIAKSGQVTLFVYDITGREVVKPFDAVLKAGSFEYILNAGSLTSGVYFYKLSANNITLTKKMTLVK